MIGLQPGAHGLLGVVLVGLRIAEIDEHAVAQIFGHETAVAAHRLGDACLIGRNQLAQVFGVHRPESAVEPTRSENMTVTWRRSAESCGCGAMGCRRLSLRRPRLDAFKVGNRAQHFAPITEKDTQLLQILIGQVGKDEKSTRFSTKRCVYSDMPSASSQCARSCIAPHLSDGR